MTQPDHRIIPLSESAVVVEFGRSISIELNDRALSLAASLETDPFPGFVEAVPAYASTTVFYEPDVLLKSALSISNVLSARTAALSTGERGTVDRVEIPVDFSAESALDIDDICSRTGFSRDDFIERFLARSYRVFMIGFLPGFAYMGEVDESIAVPRKQTPRTSVPKGSVGIAGRQTGIYPLESPGGWEIIGRTNVDIFTPDTETPSLLKPGDEVKFTRIA